MRFHAILFVRDEGDIIEESLKHILSWCDALYIYDTGSTDETWQIIQKYSQQDSRIILFKKQPTVFHDGLRAYVFDHYRKNMEDGDWVLRVDADEFYHISPPEFVKTKLEKFETCVYNQSYDFRLTQQEVLSYGKGEDNRKLTISERRRYYFPLSQSEPRMFRYRSTIKWPLRCSFPYNAGFLAKERIPIRHYPHRDPEQLQRRCNLRSMMTSLSNDLGRHWTVDDWKDLIVENDAENLCYWQPNTPLPEYHFYNHLAKFPKRFLQRIVHSSMLLIIDRLRPEFPKDYQPDFIN
ncbi:glycosyltransferase family 2 protein [Geminocystis herdmanii]|uniref:glycosyltransferase family 2 protein n=1 Tax=Geminocystis herdmanii TaxID=669359 RepID=UPI00034C36B3|nr:glycosyltransferase family 2 protein [Geminocystis herdmanii]